MSEEETLRPVGGPSTGLCSLQFNMWMVPVTQALRSWTVLLLLSVIRQMQSSRPGL